MAQESDRDSISFVVLESLNLLELDAAEPSWSLSKNQFIVCLANHIVKGVAKTAKWSAYWEPPSILDI